MRAGCDRHILHRTAFSIDLRTVVFIILMYIPAEIGRLVFELRSHAPGSIFFFVCRHCRLIKNGEGGTRITDGRTPPSTDPALAFKSEPNRAFTARRTARSMWIELLIDPSLHWNFLLKIDQLDRLVLTPGR